MIVMKFGGSSLRDAERIHEVSQLIRINLQEKPIVVASAMGKTTDMLLEAGKKALAGLVDIKAISDLHLKATQDLKTPDQEIRALLKELEDLLKGISLIKELSKKTSDYLVSFGERLSVRVLAPFLAQNGIPAKFFDAWDLGLNSDSNFGSAEVLPESYARIEQTLAPALKQYSFTPIVTGFIAKDGQGDITTLGRGGSDLTASTLGAALRVKEVQVWKDVDGILSSDPRIVPDAKPVPTLSFEEAAELAYFGAKVLHPSAILPAMQRDIPVRVKNSYNPAHPGTTIVKSHGVLKEPLRSISFKRDVILIDIVSTRMLGQYGFLANVFQIFGQFGISIDMVATSEVSISLTLDEDDDVEGVTKELSKFATVSVETDRAIISLIGDEKRSSQNLAQALAVLNKLGVNVEMISHGASKVSTALIVPEAQLELCVRTLHAEFFN